MHIKFQKNRPETVGGVERTKYLLYTRVALKLKDIRTPSCISIKFQISHENLYPGHIYNL